MVLELVEEACGYLQSLAFGASLEVIGWRGRAGGCGWMSGACGLALLDLRKAYW